LRLQAPAPYRKTRGLKARREELGAETPEEHEALSDEDLELLVAHLACPFACKREHRPGV